MARDKYVTNEVLPSLKLMGWHCRHESPRKFGKSEKKYVSGGATNELDIFAIKDGFGRFIEVKSFGDRFDFKSWTVGQREYALSLVQSGETVLYWMNGGSDRVNSAKDGAKPRRVWLLTYPQMVEMIRYHEVEMNRMSAPYSYFVNNFGVQFTFKKGLWHPICDKLKNLCIE